MDRKKIYNPFSDETLTDRKVFGGNPQGILNFTKAKYQWALKLWDLMEANTWFPKEVDTTDDAIITSISQALRSGCTISCGAS